MRKTVAALVVAMLVSLGIAVPSVGAAVGDPKVVIIVGATHGATAGYRADGDRAYTEARKYTSNVVRVYSPNATWAAVKAAVVGASVVIYMGHGNGWPSPYAYDPNYTTKDGFGLNATAGNGDYNNKYYGEPYVATLDMAPGAIVLLHHLCYASGNSEPGHAEPTVSVARQRADNYAAGFLKAGASAVIADGHSGAERYLAGLFTTHQTIEDMWRKQSNANGNFVSFASARTAGAIVHQDPETPTSGFYRSLAVGTMGVTTDEVVSAGFGDTGVHPTALVVPGNAEVTTDGAGLFADPGTTDAPAASLPAGTRLHVLERATGTTAEGTPLVRVEGLDDPSIAGYVQTTDVAARDSAVPIVRALDVGVGRFSPNGDGQGDTALVRGRFTETVAWRLVVRNAGGDRVFETTGRGTTFETAWDGRAGGAALPDGSYTVLLDGVDAWGNASARVPRTVVIDTRAPALTSLTPDTQQWFAPNGDGFRDTVTVTGGSTEAGSLAVRVAKPDGTLARNFSVTTEGGSTAVAWNGRTNSGGYAPDGAYVLWVTPVDLAGNAGAPLERPVVLIGALRSVVASAPVFYPHDGDRLARSTTLQFTLARPMTVTWTLRDAAGAVVITRMDQLARPAGTQSWTFDGRRPDGSLLPRGRYTSHVVATDGTLSVTQTVAIEADAFRISPNDVTPGRGQSITVTVVSAEALLRRPSLRISQPGVTAWSVKMTKIGTRTYRVTFRLKDGRPSGTLTLRASGRDKDGRWQQTTRTYPLH